MTTVIIPDAEDELALKVVRCLGRCGNFNIVTVAKTPSVPVSRSKYVSAQFTRTDKSIEGQLGLLMAIGEKYPNGVLLPVTLDGFRFASSMGEILAGRFRIAALPPLHTIEAASDKWQLFQIAQNHGLPLLPSHNLSDSLIRQMMDGESELRFPLLIKSRNRRGGFGFKKIQNREELERYQTSIKTVPCAEISDFIVQPFINGVDYSLSVYCEQGVIKAYTLWKALSYGGREYSIPRVVKFVEHEGILKAGARIMEVLKWSGVCDIDFFKDNASEKFWLLEINARYWQTVVAGMAAGVNFPMLGVQGALGRIDRWPIQIEGLRYSRPSGLLSLSRLKGDHIRGLSDLVNNTGVGEFVRDPMPEISAVFSSLKRT